MPGGKINAIGSNARVLNWDTNALKLHAKQKHYPTSSETALIPKIVIFKVCILSDLYRDSLVKILNFFKRTPKKKLET